MTSLSSNLIHVCNKMTLFNALLRATNFRNPILRAIIPAVGAAYTLQAFVAIPSILAESERFYDFSGSLTYLSVTALSLYLPIVRARATAELAGSLKPPFPGLIDAFIGNQKNIGFNWRQVVLSTAVTIWATRLGSYLFQRILNDGHDSRFDEIKKSPPKFFGAFMAQATWVSLCLLPVITLNSVPQKIFSVLPHIKTTDIIGLSLFVGGLAFEVIADYQKNSWVQAKRRKEHDEEFLTRGLWSKSRHPNYFGEVMLWTGIAITAAGVLASEAGKPVIGTKSIYGRILGLGVCMVSPAFSSFLLLKVSGVPLSETKYDKKYGNRPDYQKWKRETPVFFPKFW
ncbi:hypothetical protein GcC1_202015 [Golovinomyces cichoracearum]|uniref:Uncharacterized protein n=1 Tax=Golovinomyces cichoracearum TaxID=62708 RepID=A0A420HE22_9PEZI|nr:hypothetical protein GcC1_202015 [Golovinomyces cichoracearum]